MSTIVDLGDTRTVKALAIAADAGQWAKCWTRDGRKVYAVPSQTRAGAYHFVDAWQCSCPDFQRRRKPCKHSTAVRLHIALVQGPRPRQRTTKGVQS
jgi:hypothetical protein